MEKYENRNRLLYVFCIFFLIEIWNYSTICVLVIRKRFNLEPPNNNTEQLNTEHRIHSTNVLLLRTWNIQFFPFSYTLFPFFFFFFRFYVQCSTTVAHRQWQTSSVECLMLFTSVEQNQCSITRSSFVFDFNRNKINRRHLIKIKD